MKDYTVRPTHCFKWACPKCNAKNYADAIPAELEQEDREMVVDMGGHPMGWEVCPDEAECSWCDTTVRLLDKEES